MATSDTKNNVINKFIQIESWAYRGRHMVDRSTPDYDRAVLATKRIRNDLIELETLLKMES